MISEPIGYLELSKEDVISKTLYDKPDIVDFILRIKPNDHIVSNLKHCIDERLDAVLSYDHGLFIACNRHQIDHQIRLYETQNQPYINISVLELSN